MKRAGWLILLIFPAFTILLFINKFPYPADSNFSDLTISHLPYALYIHQWILRGVIPLWYGTILSGVPLAANPLSGLFYPPGWFTIIFPNIIGFNISIMLHLIFGGLGMFLLLQANNIRWSVSVLGSIGFISFSGIWRHFAAGHVSLIYSIMWLPWVLTFINRSFQKNCMKFSIMAGFCSGLMALADLRFAFMGGLFGGIYFISQLFKYQRCLGLFIAIKRILIILLITIGISSPLILPLLEYASLSTRDSLSIYESLNFSLPLINILGFFAPSFHGFSEYQIYPGALIILSFIGAIGMKKVRKNTIFWIIATFGLLIIAFGNQIPVLNLMFTLPGFNLLRVPARFSLLSEFCILVIASKGIEGLLIGEAENYPSPILFLTGVVILSIFIGLGEFLLLKIIPWQWIWAAVFGILAICIWLALKRKWIKESYGLIIACGILICDLMISNLLGFQFLGENEVLSEKQNIAVRLNQDLSLFRVYSPSYSLPQLTATIHEIQMADGVDPLQLENYQNFMEIATGVHSDSYNVTIPAFASGNPLIDNMSAIPDAYLLGILNVKYVISAFPINSDDLTHVAFLNQTYIYENELYLPRSWVQSIDSEIGTEVRSVADISWEPNRIQVTADGPGLLVLSESYYPGWIVTIDSEASEIICVSENFRGVILPHGRHLIQFVYEPNSVYIGLGLASLTLAGMLLYILLILNRHNK